MDSFKNILNESYSCLLIIVAALVLILGIYLLAIKGNASLKVIIPLSCLILGLSICAVVTSCKANTDIPQKRNNIESSENQDSKTSSQNNTDGNEEGSKSTTVAIMHVTSEEEISSDVKAESVKAYIVMPPKESK